MKITIDIVKDSYGSKFLVKSEYNEDFIYRIKALDWKTSHRKWNGIGWVVDLAAKEELKAIIKKFSPETAKEIDILLENEKKTENTLFRDILSLEYHYDPKIFPNEIAMKSKYDEKIVEICRKYKCRYDPNKKIWYIPIRIAEDFSNGLTEIYDNSVKIDEGIMKEVNEFINFAVIQIIITKRAVCDLSLMQKSDQINLWTWIRKKFGFPHPNEKMIRKHSKKDLSMWDGRIVPFKRVGNVLIFDPGFSRKVYKKIKRIGYKVEIVDNRKHLPLSVQTSFGLELYSCQSNAKELICDKINKQGFAMYQLPTGVGKTEIALSVINKMQVKTVILVNRKDLLNQWKDRIQKRLGVTAGTVGMGVFEPKDITVATVQSLWNYLKESNDSIILNEEVEDFINEIEKNSEEIEEDEAPITPEFFQMFSLVILDECHLGAARIFLKVLQNFEAKYFLSQSATTFRYDKMHPLLYGIFGKPYFRMTTEKAIELGLITPPEIRIIKGIEIESESYRRNYQKDLSKLIHSTERNKKIADIVREAPKPCLVLTNQIAHQKEIMLALKNNGIEAIGLNGNDKMEDRKTFLNQMGNGEIPVIVATTIFDEGVDAPAVNSLVLAFPMRSNVKTIQKVGRALRKFKDKKKAIIYDFNDENYYFTAQLRDRIKVYKNQKWNINY